MTSRLIKKVANYGFYSLGPQFWPGTRNQLLILAYHRVLPKSESRYKLEQPPMIVTPETLNNNIGWLKEHYQIVDLYDWVIGNLSGPNNIKCCAITFDDGWIDNLEYALPILLKHQVPATIFCVTDMLRGKNNFWPGRLTNLLQNLQLRGFSKKTVDKNLAWLTNVTPKLKLPCPTLSARDFDYCIESCKSYTDDEINSLIDNTIKSLGLDYQETRQVMNALEIQQLIRTGLIRIGSHTTQHTRLTSDTTEELLLQEIAQSRSDLEKLTGKPVNIFCYPNGFAPDRARKLVEEHYIAGVGLKRGWNNRNTSLNFLHRVGMHESIASSKISFFAKISGLL